MKPAALVLALLLAGSAGGLSAAAAIETTVPPAHAANQLPVPLKIVHPTGLPREYENTTVELELTIDAAGVPHQVETLHRLPNQVSARLCSAIAQWRFTPRYSGGQAVATRVILPLHLVDGPF